MFDMLKFQLNNYDGNDFQIVGQLCPSKNSSLGSLTSTTLNTPSQNSQAMVLNNSHNLCVLCIKQEDIEQKVFLSNANRINWYNLAKLDECMQ